MDDSSSISFTECGSADVEWDSEDSESETGSESNSSNSYIVTDPEESIIFDSEAEIPHNYQISTVEDESIEFESDSSSSFLNCSEGPNDVFELESPRKELESSMEFSNVYWMASRTTSNNNTRRQFYCDPKVRKANERWEEGAKKKQRFNQSTPNPKKDSKNVKFSEEEPDVFLVEMEDRQGTWVVDRLRFQERIRETAKTIDPILDAQHRSKVYNDLRFHSVRTNMISSS